MRTYFTTLFGEQYAVLETYIDSHTPILIKCNNCGNIFPITPNNAFTRGIRCQNCTLKNIESKGELKITDYLNNNKISFIRFKKFNDLFGVNGGQLSYDFYIENKNSLIEFQGEQHYHSVDYFGGNEKFKIQVEHDNRKRIYAKNNGFKLLEIPYTEMNNVNSILGEFLS